MLPWWGPCLCSRADTSKFARARRQPGRRAPCGSALISVARLVWAVGVRGCPRQVVQLSRLPGEPFGSLLGGSPPVGPARTAVSVPGGPCAGLPCWFGQGRLPGRGDRSGQRPQRRSCGLTFPPREEDDDGAGATAAPSSAHCQSLVFGAEARQYYGAALFVWWRWCARDSACRPSPSSHLIQGWGQCHGFAAETDRSRCGLRPISSRSSTDLAAECDRFRRGVRPISVRITTDLGERGGRLGRLIAAVACGGPVPTMKSCARRPRGRRGGPSARRRHQPAAIARIQRIQKLAPPPVCRAEVRAGVVVSC